MKDEKILLEVLKTKGADRKEVYIPVQDLIKLCGVGQPRFYRALNNLIDAGEILRPKRKAKTGCNYTYYCYQIVSKSIFTTVVMKIKDFFNKFHICTCKKQMVLN